MNGQENNRVDDILRSEPAPGNAEARLARLLKRLTTDPLPGKEISKGETSHRAHRRARASVKLSMASAVLAASLLLALGVGLGRVGTPAIANRERAVAIAPGILSAGPWAEALGRSRELTSDRIEQLAKAGKTSDLASLGTVYRAMAAELLREAADAPAGPGRTETLLALAETFQRDGSRFARLAAEIGPECREALASLAAEASRQSTRARELAG